MMSSQFVLQWKMRLERARAGAGPSLIEAVTYRLSDHTTADDASRYRDDTEVSPHWGAEPVARLRAYLMAKLWGKDREEQLLHESNRAVETAAGISCNAPLPRRNVDHSFAQIAADLALQREAACAHTGSAA